ncbi:RNA polymerase sigma factor [Rhodopirellula sp. JC639]|uniref:RNA polymerase sigma factor n=1 Tax=Stieleria mannarensis TaxID=2755585 RepID=UPI0016042966|nr:sigma-70 family RNA polymerase sigma factor [Rhodopirellula sp. JC639]
MKSSDKSNLQRNNADQFATTQWSLVLAAGNRSHEESNRALEKLCRAYWPPLYAYVRRRVSDVHQAQDLTQAFFERLLEKEYLADADPERGRFRSFLITAFKRFLAKEHGKATAYKRGGGQRTFTVDFEPQDRNWGERQNSLTAQQIYERQWAVTLLDRVMTRLRREMERSGKSQQFHLLKVFIGGSESANYATIAPALGLSESAARMAASRMRRRYRELLRDEIAQTVDSQEDIESEVQQLFATFSE